MELGIISQTVNVARHIDVAEYCASCVQMGIASNPVVLNRIEARH
jgi:hypothetical protein